MRNCFRLEVETTNAMKNTTKNASGDYIDCLGGVIYVYANTFAEAENCILEGWVKRINNIGFCLAATPNTDKS